MKFPIELDSAEIPNLINRCMTWINWSNWEKRARSLKKDGIGNPAWDKYIYPKHILELTLLEVKDYFKKTGRYPKFQTPAHYHLYAFLAVTDQVLKNLSPKAANHLKRKIHACLNNEEFLEPLRFEISTVTNLIGQGFDVHFHDLEEGGGFDFLATRDGKSLEVECKYITADIGRKIHQKKFYHLVTGLQKVIRNFQEGHTGGLILKVELPDRLEGAAIKKLQEKVELALFSKNSFSDDICSIDRQEMDITSGVFANENITNQEVAEEISSKYGLDQRHTIVNWRPRKCAILISFKSKKEDQFLKGILRQLKDDARDQFSKTKPGLLCVKLSDLSDEDLIELRDIESKGETTGLGLAANALLNSRPHLFGVAFLADGKVHQAVGNLGKVTKHQGSVFFYKNDKHPEISDFDFGKVYNI